VSSFRFGLLARHRPDKVPENRCLRVYAQQRGAKSVSNDEQPKPVAITQDPHLAMQLEEGYAPGSPLFLTIVPIFKGEGDDPGAAVTDHSLRRFIVIGLLSKQPTIVGHAGRVDADFAPDDGTCYLKTCPGAAAQRFDTPLGSFVAKPTKSGEMGLVEFECDATNSHEAKQKFVEVASLGLDHLSYIYNVPMVVTTIKVFDPKHQSTYIAFSAPYKSGVIKDHDATLYIEMKSIYAMYREAKNATSEFYRFLCFYKIMEALFGKARGRVVRQLKAKGVAINTANDLVPDDPYLPLHLKEHVGKTIKWFYDNVLANQFRNAVAHFATEHGTLDVSSPAEIDKFASMAFVADLCVRHLIHVHEQLLLTLHSK
jgi:hypothetical protein